MRRKLIKCVLCLKEDTREETGVCMDCRQAWEVGCKLLATRQREKEKIMAYVSWFFDMNCYRGEPEEELKVSNEDLVEAMGGTLLSGSTHGVNVPGKPVFVGLGPDHGESGGNLAVAVPRVRAEAMQRIIAAFINAVARAHWEGIQTGRSLLGGLASGKITPEEFDHRCKTWPWKRPRGSKHKSPE